MKGALSQKEKKLASDLGMTGYKFYCDARTYAANCTQRDHVKWIAFATKYSSYTYPLSAVGSVKEFQQAVAIELFCNGETFTTPEEGKANNE